MRLGVPTLRVKDLDRVLSFYIDGFNLEVKKKYYDKEDGLKIWELGFRRSSSETAKREPFTPSTSSQLSDGPLIAIKHDPNVEHRPSNSAGLYHYAILLPDRKSLASTYLALGTSDHSEVIFDGFADHGISEALYLHDPEGNGIEIYSDKPKAEWSGFLAAMRKDAGSSHILSITRPLDIDSLLKDLSKEERSNPIPFPRGGRIGHIHLSVTELERSVRFYTEKIGLDIVGNLRSVGVAFLSVGGYHHHIGLNTWESLNGVTHLPRHAGLDSFKLILPSSRAFEALLDQFSISQTSDVDFSILDPDGIKIRVENASP